jgi:hypothetical protein
VTQVIHAHPGGTVAFEARNLETDERAVIVTTPHRPVRAMTRREFAEYLKAVR